MAENKALRVSFVGDIMIGRSFNQRLEEDVDIWGDTTEHLKNSDLVIGNLETTLTDHKVKLPGKVFNFRLGMKYASILKQIGIDYVSLANNHILDYGIVGAKDTMKVLDSMDIKYSGAGENVQKPAVFNIRGQIIHVYSIADHYRDWNVKEMGVGIWYVDVEKPEEVYSNQKRKNRCGYSFVSYAAKLCR